MYIEFLKKTKIYVRNNCFYSLFCILNFNLLRLIIRTNLSKKFIRKIFILALFNKF